MEKVLGLEGDEADRGNDHSAEDQTMLKYLDAASEEVRAGPVALVNPRSGLHTRTFQLRQISAI